jgi:hypothetical protein
MVDSVCWTVSEFIRNQFETEASSVDTGEGEDRVVVTRRFGKQPRV